MAAVALVAWALDSLLWLWLYLRPGPFGKPFALDPAHYLFHALFYGLWAHTVVAVPFAAWARRSPGLSRLRVALQIVASAALMLVGAVDREFQRFLGMHLSVSWLKSYAALDRTPAVIWDTLRADQGGAWSSLFGLLVVVSFPILALFAARRLTLPTPGKRTRYAFAFFALLLPTVLWNFIPGGKQRQTKIQPALVLVTRELSRPPRRQLDPAVLARSAALFQKHYAASPAAAEWLFIDPEYPLLKRYAGPAPQRTGKRPNFVVLSLETFRAKDMASMNPAFEGAPPTPFLDSLARSDHSAYFPRYFASGVPTVHAFMSIHTSLIPHPARSIPAESTTDYLKGFPAFLRDYGYHTAHFTGSDPDWDSQRVWLDRWYDEVQFHPEDAERDRATFRRAATRMRELGARQAPFLMYIASISNHTPFRVPEQALAMNEGATTVDALHNTMHYTDDVVRELYTSLESEPWFDDTIWIITGDHGFDLGDRGESGGHDNLHHETTWVPLIMHGHHPSLPRGEQAMVGSHLDLAPTILELANVWDDNAFMGRSLLKTPSQVADALVMRGGGHAYETETHSLFKPRDGAPMIYDRSDSLQRQELSATPPALAADAQALADAYSALITHVIDRDRVQPRDADEGPATERLQSRRLDP